MINPPQSPGLGVAVADVNTIGSVEVPTAFIIPPCNTAINTSDPVVALTTTPGSTFKVIPSGTIRADSSEYSVPAVRVKSSSRVPPITRPVSYTHLTLPTIYSV